MTDKYQLNASTAQLISFSSLILAEVSVPKGTILRSFGFSPTALVRQNQLSKEEASTLNRSSTYLSQEETLFHFPFSFKV